MSFQGPCSLIVCPACHGGLEQTADELECRGCGATYPIEDGIPVLLGEGARSADQKLSQAEFFDEGDHDFEVRRPHGTPGFHGWLLAEKFQRSITGIAGLLPNRIALATCAGSGMDAEFLARRGARVIACDISLGAAKRAQERARHYRLPVWPVVGDAERLPFADKAIDVAYVHDGLHHLDSPESGLAEMLRIAHAAVSITEPAEAQATRLAVRLGLALDYEPAGNEVRRFTLGWLCDELARGGFSVVEASRYAMYYTHNPGAPTRLLSRSALLPFAKRGVGLVNAGLGRFGNKLAVQAVRQEVSGGLPVALASGR